MKKDLQTTFRSDLQAELAEILKLSPTNRSLEIYFEHFRQKEQISRYKDLDMLVFTRMYGRKPENSEALKIRYWRCGQHIPKNREEMIRLGLALEVSLEELNIMLTEILLETRLNPQDLPESVFSSADLPVIPQTYDDSSDFLSALSRRYLALVPESRLRQLSIKTQDTENYLRHILFSDIMDCIWYPEAERTWYHRHHIYSRNFSSECARYFKKGEKISRSTLQRLLMVMLMPEIDADIMNASLEHLGYAPLSPEIQQKSGARTDCLFLWVLEQFKRYRTHDLEADKQLLKKMLQSVDGEVAKYHTSLRSDSTSEGKKKRKQLHDLRIMKFRSFGEN